MPTAPVLTITLNPAIDLELEVPTFDATQLMRSTAARRSAGGKGLNVSRVLAALGVRNTAAALVGGADAAVFTELLAGAPFEFIPLQPKANGSKAAAGVRTNVTISAAGHAVCKVNQPGFPISAAAWPALKLQIAKLCAHRKWVVAAGTLPPGAQPTIYAQLTRAAHQAGAQVALDCAGEPLHAALAQHPDLVKINAAELFETAPYLGAPAGRGWRALDSAIAALLKHGARNVIVTHGSGQIMATGKLFPEPITFTPPPTQAKGKVGAGDAFLAGFLAALLKHKKPDEALRHATAAAAATISLPDPIFPTRQQLQTMLKMFPPLGAS